MLEAAKEWAPRGARLLTIVVVSPRDLIRVGREFGLRGVSHAKYRLDGKPPKRGALCGGARGDWSVRGSVPCLPLAISLAVDLQPFTDMHPYVYPTHVIIEHVVPLGGSKHRRD